MLYRRSRESPEKPLFGSGVVDLSANEVADATMRAVKTIRKSESALFIVSLVKAISDATKGNVKQSKREEALQAIASDLFEMDFIILRRRVVPDVLYCIETGSFVSATRKAKVATQFKELVSSLDRILN